VFAARRTLPPMFRNWNAEECPSHFLEEIIAYATSRAAAPTHPIASNHK
jgi:hypothetical protein